MNITFYEMSEDNRTLYKTPTNPTTLDVIFKDDTSVTDPVIIVTNFDPTKNYFYILTFGRWYYVTDYEPMTGGRTKVTGHVDVLYSFKEQIGSLDAVLRKSSNKGNDYFVDSSIKTLNKDTYEVLYFTNNGTQQGERKKFGVDTTSVDKDKLIYLLTVLG